MLNIIGSSENVLFSTTGTHENLKINFYCVFLITSSSFILFQKLPKLNIIVIIVLIIKTFVIIIYYYLLNLS